MKYNTFVQRVTQDERRQRAMLPKYQGDKLLETLNSVLMMPDCPGRNEAVSTLRAVRQVSTPLEKQPLVQEPPAFHLFVQGAALESMLLAPRV